ncbi:MAG: hydroxylamine reductase, partial [Victivallales bacterium]|nr:hydroxylamine reductase [Victivallales bacterium]
CLKFRGIRANPAHSQSSTEAGPATSRGVALGTTDAPLQGMVGQGQWGGPVGDGTRLGAGAAGLTELLLYGLKGTAAYAHRARTLGREAEEIDIFLERALDTLASGHQEDWELLALCLECGKANLRAMEILHRAQTAAFGQPEPTQVRITPVIGKAILVSGHDLSCLAELLQQTAERGIHVYTHGELLPAHGYPALKRHPHLVGNFGGAWRDQQHEFTHFPGAILMTTNCVLEPAASYRDRMFTADVVSWPGVPHIQNRNFSPLIQAAMASPGFLESGPDQTVTVGYSHEDVLALVPQLVGAIRSGCIRRLFLIGGCDGAKAGRKYYTRLARIVPQDCAILTLACGRCRFNKVDFGTIGGVPRLLDIGQCNDAYSATRIMLALSEALECDINELPVSIVLSWHEQEAIAMLLSMLHLGLKDIRLGPGSPACVNPAIRNALNERFDIRPITSPEQDLEELLLHTPDLALDS